MRTLQTLHKVGRLGYWQVSRVSGEVYWSEMVYAFLGVNATDVVPGHAAFMAMVHPLDQEKVAKSLQTIAETGLADIKYRIVQPSGHIRWLHEIADNSSFDDPDIFFGTLHDITVHKSLEEKLRKQAITDDLTGVFNRGYFMKRLRKAFLHYQRSGQNGCVLLFDVDYFKVVNDTYGHAMGDTVLQQVCHLFKERFRETDVVGRLGGEEFAVLLFETTPEDAVSVAEDVRKALAHYAFETQSGRTFHVTMTGGVASFKEEDITEDSILHRADKSLYLGKQHGRDQVVSHGK